MLNPAKLYKSDMAHTRTPVTFGPKGKPKAGCEGTLCYRNKNADWAVHRLTPAVLARRKPGGVAQRAVGNTIVRAATRSGRKFPQEDLDLVRTHPGELLHGSSPRWGPGIAPGRKQRNVVPLPPKGAVDFSKKTKVATAGGATAAAGYSYSKGRSSNKGRSGQRSNSFS